MPSPGGAGARPLPLGARRVAAAVRSAVRVCRPIAWIGGVASVLPALALAFVLVVLLGESLPAI